MALRGRSPLLRALVVTALTIVVLFLSAVLLPPEGGNAKPRDGSIQAPALSSH